MKIALVGLYYPVAMLHYFRRALERRDDVELVTVGPFTNTWIPWDGGINLPPKYVYTPHHPLPQRLIQNGKINPQIFQMFDDLADVDLWLEVDAGFYLDPKPQGLVAHVATDPHCLNYDRQRELADYFFNMQTPYMKQGDLYLPYAFDPTLHYPEEREKLYDACLIGLQYTHRIELINRIKLQGAKVYSGIGDVYDEYRARYNESRVALSWSSLQDTPTRVFEAMGMGLPLVSNRTPDLSKLFVDERHYLGFDNAEEGAKQVMRLLLDDDLREEIANAGHKAVQSHTWDARVQQILENVGLL